MIPIPMNFPRTEEDPFKNISLLKPYEMTYYHLKMLGLKKYMSMDIPHHFVELAISSWEIANLVLYPQQPLLGFDHLMVKL